MSNQVQSREGYETVLAWLCAEMRARQMVGKVYTDAVEVQHEPSLRRPIVVVPIYVGGYDDLVEEVKAMQSLAAAWNEQEPEPEVTLFLRPAAKPRAERQF